MPLFEYECLNLNCTERKERLIRSLDEAPEFDRCCDCGWTMIRVEMSRPGYRRDHTTLDPRFV